MKLKTYTEEDKIKYIEVDYWSFMKCYIFVYIGIGGIIFALAFILGVLVGTFGA